MKIVSWNVNSVRARLANIAEYVNESSPDVLLMQEIKCVNEVFPVEFFEDLGYSVAVFGQKSYNGVAIAARSSIEDVVTGIPGYRDDQARYIEATIDGYLRVASVYMPNGNPINTAKFDYKIEFMQAFNKHAKKLLADYAGEHLLLAGDMNVARNAQDVYSEEVFAGDAIYQVESKTEFNELLELGYVDTFRTLNPADNGYSYWGYQGGDFRKNQGCRIDFMLLPNPLLPKVKACYVDKETRAKPSASDHAPLVLEL